MDFRLGRLVRRIAVSLVAASAALAGVSAGAQTPPAQSAQPGPPPIPLTAAPDDGNSAVVSELLVVARPPGPALWKVSRGASQVVILGGLAPLPQSLDWNKLRLQRALAQSNLLLLPPSGRVNLFSAAGFMLHAGAVRQPFGHTLEGSLPPPLSQRFARLREGLGLGPDRYAHWKPAVAGYMLLMDFRRKAGLANEKPNTTVRHMAEDQHIPIKTIGDYRLALLFRSLTQLNDQQQQACLVDELDAIELEASHARDAATAWASGDLAVARAFSSGPILDGCLAELSSYGQVLEQGAATFTAAVEDALNRPGGAVAVIDLRYLLRADGVLDRLRADGATVTTPGP